MGSIKFFNANWEYCELRILNFEFRTRAQEDILCYHAERSHHKINNAEHPSGIRHCGLTGYAGRLCKRNSFVELGEVFERPEAIVNLQIGKFLQTFRAESLNAEGSQSAAINHCTLKVFF